MAFLLGDEGGAAASCTECQKSFSWNATNIVEHFPNIFCGHHHFDCRRMSVLDPKYTMQFDHSSFSLHCSVACEAGWNPSQDPRLRATSPAPQ